MSINATTLSAAITASQTTFGVASATGFVVGNNQTGQSVTYVYIEAEMMLVTGVSGTQITVIRGVLGTAASAHGNTAPVLAGLVTDFPNFTPAQSATTQAVPGRFGGISAPVASATTIVATGSVFHVTGTTAIATITPPTNFVEGKITIIFDGVDTWTAGGNIAVAGTNTTAASAVDFVYDAATSKWYPLRLA